MGWLKKLRVTRVNRLRLYLDHLDRKVPVKNKKDRENLDYLKGKMNAYIIKMGVFSYSRAFFYAILYASVVANFIGDLATGEAGKFITRFTSPIIILSTILGTTISITYILIFSKFVNTYWEDVRTYASHMIAIYAKYDTKGEGLMDYKNEKDD